MATDNFNPKNIIGEGGFGTVYKGRIDNMDVAIKVLKKVGCYRFNYIDYSINLAYKFTQPLM